jgi:hypothetical protein
MPQYEYEKVNLGDLPRNADELDLLDELGREGWELIVVLPNNVAYLKRQMTPARGELAASRTRA